MRSAMGASARGATLSSIAAMASAASTLMLPASSAAATCGCREGRGAPLNSCRVAVAVPTEINVIGENVDEATRRVEKFIDRAFLAGATRVRIVHGSGMGILRKALRQYLQNHPQVASVTEPPQNEGGGGATVVELRL